MKKSATSKVFGFIAMGLALISIGMLFLPFISIKAPESFFDDEKETYNCSLFTILKIGAAIDDEDVADDLEEYEEVFAAVLLAESDDEDEAKGAVAFVAAMAFVSMAFALITAACAAIDIKATRIISIVTSFIAFAAATVEFILFAGPVGEAKEELGSDIIEVHLGIGLILAFAFLFIAMIMAILALVFMGKTAVAGGQFNGGFGVGNYPDDTVVNGGGYGQQPMTPGAPAAPVQPKASLTFLSGSCAGYQIPMDSGEEVVIGKDPALCAVVIDKKYDKVSRKHCGVRFDAMRNMYIVTDYSTNGTRVVGGQKLTPHSTSYVERGTTINLGHTENSFRLN